MLKMGRYKNFLFSTHVPERYARKLDLSYFDIIRYCNERSEKSHGYITIRKSCPHEPSISIQNQEKS